MAKYSVPGIRFTEIDNSIRTESEPGMGIGAIVMKSNKGPVNQRIVTKNYNEFTDIFGEPETLTDYGHFAAENYFQNSTQLFAVRATMGDEQYSQIQFSYPDASVTATNKSNDTCVINYVDNQEDNRLVLLQPLSAVTVYENMIESDDWEMDDVAEEGFVLRQKAKCGQFNNIESETSDIIVFKSNQSDISDVVENYGTHIIYPSYVDVNGDNPIMETKLMLNEDAYDAGTYSADGKMISITAPAGYRDHNARQVKITVPKAHTLNEKQTSIKFFGNWSAVSAWQQTGVQYKDIFNADVFYGDFNGDWDQTCAETSGYGVQDAAKISVIDWDAPSTDKKYYIDESDISSVEDAYGIKYYEFNKVDPRYAIIARRDLDPAVGTDQIFISAVSAMYSNDEDMLASMRNDDYGKRTPKQVIRQMLDYYGISDIAEINNYCYLSFFNVFTQTIQERIIKDFEYNKLTSTYNLKEKPNPYLFYYYSKKGDTKGTTTSVFMSESPEFVALPIQDGFVAKTDDKTPLNSIIATPTSYIVNSVDKTYADGYTVLTQTNDEPGNGDIEGYNSVFDNQLVIASIGPGKYGDDIGVSIITTACADVVALQHQNAFNWKDKYDDADLIANDADDLTWKKVFRINVYVKNKTQTAEGAWGTGMEALTRDPAETWYVSTDPYAKDLKGNSLFAPTVVNGHSEYIYISRSSIGNALNAQGKYEQPNQTYSIYQLTGGKNSEKNNIAEKTAALNFYKDRQRAKFDILFNCDAIDDFTGKYEAHQNKIAQIAASRTMDIGVVQVTSKAAKTAKQMLSESKNFSYQYGPTYIAQYGGYDKYYNSTLASWIYLPKSVAGACAMAYCDTFSYPWMAPAGVARGTISYTAGQLLRLSDDEIGQLYDNNVNTTRDCGGYGVVLWGQKTALKKNSLLNRINVRRCLNYIEKQLENMMTPYLFMQNSVNTRSSARNDIDSFLQRVQAAEGLDRYSLSVTQDPDDPTIMNVNIRLVPTSAIEFIDVKIFIDRNSGVTVAEG